MEFLPRGSNESHVAYVDLALRSATPLIREWQQSGDVVGDVTCGVAVTGYILNQTYITGSEPMHGAVAKSYLQFPRESNHPPFVGGLVKI